MHLGLIGGIGPAATEFYYRGLLRHGSDIALTISHLSLDVLVGNLTRDARQEQAEVYAEHLASLKAAGADFAAITSVAGHFCHAETAAITPLPLVDGLETLDRYFADAGVERIGLIGSRFTMESGLFGAVSAAEMLVPETNDLALVGEAYIAMARRGTATAEERETCIGVGRTLIDRGADAVLLGGTDLFLAFEGHDPGFPVIDAAEVHIARLDRILRRAEPPPVL